MSDIANFIYESINSGKMTKYEAIDLLMAMESSSMNREIDSAMDEMEDAESSFMESALEYAYGDEEVSVFEKKAETFGDKIKAAWEKFKAWVKKIKDSIFKKFCDLTGTYYVDKNKWTWLQKMDAALKKGYNMLLPKANKMSDLEIDKTVDDNPDSVVANCFLDATKLAISAASVIAVKAVYIKMKTNMLLSVNKSIGTITAALTELGDKSKNTVVKGIMTVLRPILKAITSISNSIQKEFKAANDYKRNKRQGYDKDKALTKALDDNGYDPNSKWNKFGLKYDAMIS